MTTASANATIITIPAPHNWVKETARRMRCPQCSWTTSPETAMASINQALDACEKRVSLNDVEVDIETGEYIEKAPPQAPAPQVRMATRKQLSYIQSLMDTRNTKGLDLPVSLTSLTIEQATALIDTLKAAPKAQAEAKPQAPARKASQKQVAYIKNLLERGTDNSSTFPRLTREVAMQIARREITIWAAYDLDPDSLTSTEASRIITDLRGD